ncbi:hypothetical protein BCU68_07390 [Vibrio sp. 10N.286.49.B3]|uniref:LuxR C-terminal-related transcriptional regulator n=1 Tax=Vibrio sp. 10N.286.49.B3 TaxID=1880855 RepID=UPI000C842B33|nr:LuxR C-terminal-related transcriptional regulator [Vibrio sp. 10N.286.49.B3]PMH39909.1 hypothetical protein BCU68_07390 [Vibrio sp. 10N.286.49.B3]
MTLLTRSRKMYFLTNNDNEHNLFIHRLMNEFNTPIENLSPYSIQGPSAQHFYRILIIDYSRYALFLEKQPNLHLLHQNYEVVLFNVERRLTTKDLMTFNHLKGFFYKETPYRDIVRGFHSILSGVDWLPREICAQILHAYRQGLGVSPAELKHPLSLRESEVLEYLKVDMPTHDIAEELNISIYTVKSHLASIYRKISVRNRSQAQVWAKRNTN